MTDSGILPAFAGYGIELEYMIVDRTTLDVRPVADELLHAVAGAYVGDVERGSLAWSNELVAHVIELKTNGPAKDVTVLDRQFHTDITTINDLLAPLNACLMPSAMHPWMNPLKEMKLWPHDDNEIYAAFDRIFGCRGHGWANLQSVHINLPFADDDQFGRLHCAIRLVLPLLPGLAASSPLRDGMVSGSLDTRLAVYKSNCAKIPQITGHVIPEPVLTRSCYESNILQPMYAAIAPHDPGNILQDEWLNARGAIARFDRNAIEIRVLDIQECPLADLATTALVIEVVKALYEERWSSFSAQQLMTVADLASLLDAGIRDAELAIIDDRQLLDLFACPEQRCEVRELWQHLITQVTLDARLNTALAVIIDKGPLARRLLRASGPNPSPAKQHEIYKQLCACLANNSQFV